MTRNLKLAALLVVAGGAIMVPLYGDSRNAPVTHAEWGQMLLRGLDMADAVEQRPTAAAVFSVLSWRNSLSYRAPQYASADRVRVTGTGDARSLVADGGVGEVTYPVAVTRAGNYRLRARLAGQPEHPVSAEITRVGKTDAAGTFTLVGASAPGWVEGGSAHLDPGAYAMHLLLPAGTELHAVEVAPPCVAPIEPLGGWVTTDVLDAEDLAVTVLRARDAEHELPPADTPIEVPARAFQVDDAQGRIQQIALDVNGSGMLTATASPLRAAIFLDIVNPGLYSIAMYGLRGDGLSWQTDSCRKTVLCRLDGKEQAAWHQITSVPLGKGRHALTVVVGPGGAIDRVRAERKKDSGADYVATLQRLGFEAPGAGNVSRAKATEAMDWVKGRSGVLLGTNTCGDVLLPYDGTTMASGQLAPTQLAQPQAPPGATGPGQPPLGAPFVPGATPAPPVAVVSPTPIPPGPSPTPTPVPPTPPPPVPPSPSPSPSPTPTPSIPPPPSPLPSQTPTPVLLASPSPAPQG